MMNKKVQIACLLGVAILVGAMCSCHMKNERVLMACGFAAVLIGAALIDLYRRRCDDKSDYDERLAQGAICVCALLAAGYIYMSNKKKISEMALMAVAGAGLVAMTMQMYVVAECDDDDHKEDASLATQAPSWRTSLDSQMKSVGDEQMKITEDEASWLDKTDDIPTGGAGLKRGRALDDRFSGDCGVEPMCGEKRMDCPKFDETGDGENPYLPDGDDLLAAAMIGPEYPVMSVRKGRSQDLSVRPDVPIPDPHCNVNCRQVDIPCPQW